MSPQLNLKDAERQVLRLATFQDGLWDLFLGVFLLMMSLYDVTRNLLGPALNLVLVLLVIFVTVFIVWWAKIRFIIPRTGLVRFSPSAKKQIRSIRVLTWVLFIITFAILVLGRLGLFVEPTWRGLPAWASEFDIDAMFALAAVALFALAANNFGTPRLYLYGWLLGLSMLASAVILVYQETQFQYPFAIAGLIIVTIGGFVLNRFLRQYPIPTEEA
jgi:hypothetical protein